ncbi:MAG: hypothetical protein HUU50_14090 [Candidatus Brocadiae bacterium]|nr:hypothetical protein [Candidatus Brocadiia bacterium]
MTDEIKKKAARMVFQEQLMQNAIGQGVSHEIKPGVQQKPSEKLAMNIPEQKTSEELQQEKAGMKIRETGWLLWRTVVVPPNAYVVHTRRGQNKPVTLGLGQSFRYYPRIDSYLVVPAALQTIGIVAQGVSKEKQGISILAYVQWLISNFAIAYQRLDFSDPKDPMGIVNAQLREQAEAAIKDKISTMSVEEILTDKAPIIEELTQRMKAVAEGSIQGDRLSGMGGLGLHIVTVQIKEAYVCSQHLWEFLQTPFRNEKEREARLSRLRVEEEIKQQELTNLKRIESGQAQTEADIAKFKAEKESESFEVVVKERLKRQEKESEEKQKMVALYEQTELQGRLSQKKLQENELQTKQELEILKIRQAQEFELEKSKLEAQRYTEEKQISVESKIQASLWDAKLEEEDLKNKLVCLENQKTLQARQHEVEQEKKKNDLALEKLELEHKIAAEDKEFQAAQLHEEQTNRLKNANKEEEIKQQKLLQEIANGLSSEYLVTKMIETLPDLAKALPEIKELKTLQISSEGKESNLLFGSISKILAIANALGVKVPGYQEP